MEALPAGDLGDGSGTSDASRLMIRDNWEGARPLSPVPPQPAPGQAGQGALLPLQASTSGSLQRRILRTKIRSRSSGPQENAPVDPAVPGGAWRSPGRSHRVSKDGDRSTRPHTAFPACIVLGTSDSSTAWTPGQAAALRGARGTSSCCPAPPTAPPGNDLWLLCPLLSWPVGLPSVFARFQGVVVRDTFLSHACEAHGLVWPPRSLPRGGCSPPQLFGSNRRTACPHGLPPRTLRETQRLTAHLRLLHELLEPPEEAKRTNPQ